MFKNIKKQLNQNTDSDLDFLDSTIKKDEIAELQFAVLKDVYLTKKDEQEAVRFAAEAKAHNNMIDIIIAEKEQEEIRNLSKEELLKLRK